MDREDFESAVAEALDHLPPEFAELMSNVSIQVREVPDEETLAELDLDPRVDTLYGLYTGVPLDQRATAARAAGWFARSSSRCCTRSATTSDSLTTRWTRGSGSSGGSRRATTSRISF